MPAELPKNTRKRKPKEDPEPEPEQAQSAGPVLDAFGGAPTVTEGPVDPTPAPAVPAPEEDGVDYEPVRVQASAQPTDFRTADGIEIIKITAGYTEKIGLPGYSSLQIGPVSLSRMVPDAGKRITWEEAGIPCRNDEERARTVSVDVSQALKHTFYDAEAVMRVERSSAIAFIEAAQSQTHNAQGPHPSK
jgi:hypothetical protein